MTVTEQQAKPWYRQFWPWFLIILPATVVAASLATVYIAFHNADALVDDNYYRDGLAINRYLAQDTVAADLDLAATLRFDRVSGEVLVELSGNLQFPAALQLLLMHPVDEQRDMSLALIHSGNGRYRGDLVHRPRQRYYLRLQPAGDGAWRLNGEVDFSVTDRVSIHHNG